MNAIARAVSHGARCLHEAIKEEKMKKDVGQYEPKLVGNVTLNSSKNHRPLSLRSGETVGVRGESEIARTLDGSGCLEGLPFMPEMSKYCERSFTVLKRVDNMLIEGLGPRRIRNTVILDGVTCDGSAHRGCGRTCPILWKEAWLKRVDGATGDEPISGLDVGPDTVIAQEKLCSCQLINLRKASHPPLSLEGLTQRLRGTQRERTRLETLLVSLLWLCRSFLRKLGRTRPNAETLRGSLKRTPVSYLNLRPRETVEVKNRDEIAATLDSKGRNRGLAFSPEMLRYCGKQYRVLKRIDKMIDENTGRMRPIANTVILEDVPCDGSFHGDCPRNCYCLWREAWLKRVE